MKLRSLAVAAIAFTSTLFAQPTPKALTASAAASPDDAVKIVALNAIMNADPDRGIPLAEGLLKGSADTALKDRALAVLSQNKSPQAQQILTQYATSATDPDLRVRAIRYIGRNSSKETQQQLASLYASSTDTRAKQEILRALSGSGATDALVNLAKTEKDVNLRDEAIRDLASSDSTPAATLVQIYSTETETAPKRTIVNMLAGRGDAKSVIELGRAEKDPQMKTYIVQRLGGMKNNADAINFMADLLK